MSLLLNSVTSLILLAACTHLVFHWLFYLLITVSMALRTDRRSSRVSSITLSVVVLAILMSYNSVLYSIVFSRVNWSNLFTSRSLSTTVTDSQFLIVIAIEPFIFILLSLFKCACAFFQQLRCYPDVSIMMKLSLDSQDRGVQIPDVYILMPMYNEPIERLKETLDSIVENTYPKNRLRLVVACDDDRITPAFTSLFHLVSGQERLLPDSIIIGSYRGLRVDLARFPHGGKRHAQMCAFLYLQQLLRDQLEKPLLLFLDSDIVLNRFAIAHFVYTMMSRPWCEALTGLITISSDGFLSCLQNCEYIDSQMLHRSTESLLGGVSCLPGALAIIRFESLRLVSREYFAQTPAVDSFNFAKRSLGEDRYLTSLLLESDKKGHRIIFSPAGRCQTPGCLTFVDLMRQRRRWFLGTISNEVAMLTSWKIWRSVPGLQLLQLSLSIRNTPLFAYLVLVELIQVGELHYIWPVAAAIISVYFPIWITVSYVTVSIQSPLKTILVFPIYVALMPVFSVLFEIYGILSCRQKSWGGPRMQQAVAESERFDMSSEDSSVVL